MHLEAHAGVGWIIGMIAPGSERRLRNCCLVAAVLPDIDAAAYLAGPVAYSNYHHTFGHNVFLGLLVVGVSVALHRGQSTRRLALAGACVALSFGLHLLSDAFFTRYPVYLWWPLSQASYVFRDGVWLGHWSNHLAVGLAVASILPLALWRRITPLDVFWPRLDRIFIRALSPRRLSCKTCGRGCNHRCDACGTPTCLRHGRVGWRWRITCPDCGDRAASEPAGSG